MTDKKGQRAKIAIISRCPVCQGTGRVAREVPFLANPKAPATRPKDMGLKTCPRCKGSGVIGIK